MVIKLIFDDKHIWEQKIELYTTIISLEIYQNNQK